MAKQKKQRNIKATVTVPFSGCRDGEPGTVTNFVEGDRLSGSLAHVAVREGWAETVKPAKKAATKAKVAAPKNKSK
jgi:hypothetical protein